MSTYAKFWFTFLGGSLLAVYFVDFEKLILQGEDPREKARYMELAYDRDTNPKAQEIDDEDGDYNNQEKNTKDFDVHMSPKLLRQLRELYQATIDEEDISEQRVKTSNGTRMILQDQEAVNSTPSAKKPKDKASFRIRKVKRLYFVFVIQMCILNSLFFI